MVWGDDDEEEEEEGKDDIGVLLLLLFLSLSAVDFSEGSGVDVSELALLLARTLLISSLSSPFVFKKAVFRSTDSLAIDSSCRNLAACSRRVVREGGDEEVVVVVVVVVVFCWF